MSTRRSRPCNDLGSEAPWAAFTLYHITFDPIQKCSFSLAFTLYRITFDPIQKCSFSLAFTLHHITFDSIQKCSFSLAFTLYRITLDPIQKCSFSLAFTLHHITFDPIQKCSFSLAFTLHRMTFDPIQKCSFSLAFTLYRHSFRAVQAQNCFSFLAGSESYWITLSSVNAWLFRNTFVSDQKVIWYSVKTREKEHFCIGSKSDLVQCKRQGKGALLYYSPW